MVCRASWPQVGGMERAVHDLAVGMVARGHQVWCVSLAWPGQAHTPGDEAHWEGVTYKWIAARGPRVYPSGRGLLAAVAGADLVHVHGLDGLADHAVRVCPMPVGVSTHGGYHHNARGRWFKALWVRAVTRRTLALADAVWFTSAVDEALYRGPQGKGRVLGNGVQVARLRPLGRSPVAGFWLILGRVAAHKGIERAIAAIAAMTADPPTLHVVGPIVDASWAQMLIDRARHEGVRLIMHGQVTDAELRGLLRVAEVALFPSTHEGFGLALAEVVGAGVPAIVGEDDALGLIAQDGVADRIAFSRSADAAAALDDWRPPTRAACEHRAARLAARYGWAVMGARWEQAYQSILRGP